MSVKICVEEKNWKKLWNQFLGWQISSFSFPNTCNKRLMADFVSERELKKNNQKQLQIEISNHFEISSVFKNKATLQLTLKWLVLWYLFSWLYYTFFWLSVKNIWLKRCCVILKKCWKNALWLKFQYDDEAILFPLIEGAISPGR